MITSAPATSLHAQTPRAPTVIESVTPQWTAATALKVDPKPTLTLGVNEPLFATVAGAHRYVDGRIVVADSKAKELLMFGADGKFVRTIARSGSGPGEFQAFDQLISAGGDTLAVWDWRTRHLTYFGESGQVLRTGALTPLAASNGQVSPGVPTPIGRFVDGSLLAERPRSDKRKEITNMAEDFVTYYVLAGGSAKSIGDFYSKQWWTFYHANGNSSFGPGPFSRLGSIATGPSSFFVSDALRFDVTEYDRNGAVIRILRIRRAPIPATYDLITQYKRDFKETDEKQDAEVIKWMPFPKTLPTFKQLIRDNDGRIWASQYNVNPSSSRYDVFDAGGRWLGAITFPSNSTLLEAGKDWVLLRVVLEGGESLVQLHRLAQ
ncbi:MAG: 6-bladed beta-propeller [Gemmatimonas sp.]